jgi:hypothetical protein
VPLINVITAYKIGHRSLREKAGDLIPDQSDESFKVSLGWQNDLLGDKEDHKAWPGNAMLGWGRLDLGKMIRPD